MLETPNSRERFLAACRRVPLAGPPPGWVMRQAGRYLPEYRAMREGKSFLEMVHAPEVAAEITTDGGWMDLSARKLAPPPPDLLAALQQVARTESFREL